MMPNLLPLETFRALFGMHPVHFWGLSGALAPITSACNTVTREHAWQDAQAMGRQEIREAIETAEARLREWLGYSAAPEYISETHPYSNGLIRLERGYVQAIGTETLTRLQGASVVLEDTDADDLKDTFDITYQTDEDPAELALYFLPEDRLDDDPVSDRWRVQPLRVVTDGDLIHIRGKAWQLVRPALLERVGDAAIDPAVSSNFVDGLDIYRRTTASPQATLTWRSGPYPPYCCESTTDPAAIATAAARVGLVHAELGIVAATQAAYDETASAWYAVPWSGCRLPDQVTINYLAGVPLESGQMARTWQTIVARLAAAELAAPICACNVANRTLAYWQTDVARTGGNNDEQFGAIAQQDLTNPFGTRRGHIYAWKAVNHLRQMRGLAPG